MKIEELKDKVEKATIAVATVDSKGKPHNIAIMYAKVKGKKIIITNNHMVITVKNIKNNPSVSLVFWEGEEGWRVDGKAEYYDSGEWLEFVKGLEENKDFPAKGAVVVEVEEIRRLC